MSFRVTSQVQYEWKLCGLSHSRPEWSDRQSIVPFTPLSPVDDSVCYHGYSPSLSWELSLSHLQAPENIQGKVTYTTDVYSLACIAHELIMGERYDRDNRAMILSAKLQQLSFPRASINMRRFSSSYG